MNADVIVPLISPKLSREPTPVSELLGEEKEEPKIEETEDVAKSPTPVPAAHGKLSLSLSYYIYPKLRTQTV